MKMSFDQYVKGNALVVVESNMDMGELVGFLKDNRNITRLGFREYTISDEGVKELAKLTNLTNVTFLYLSHNNVGDEGVKELAKLTNLAKLYLSNNNIGVEGAKALADLTNLTELYLSHNNVGDEGAKELAKLTNLAKLYLSHNNVGDEGAKALADLTNLTELYLSNNNIGVEGAKALADLTNLTELYLSNNNIGVEGAKALANGNLQNLTALDLSNNNIGVEGAKALANGNLQNLTALNLSNNNIGVEGLEALADLTNLTKLDLSNNNIGVEGAKALANGNLQNLTALDLPNNNIGVEGAKALADLTNLTKLDLSNNNIGVEGAKALANGNLQNLTALNLPNNNIGVEGVKALADLTNLTNLTKLYLSNNNIGVEGIEALANGNLQNLTALDLSNNNIGVEGAKALANGNLQNLTALNLSNNNIGDEGLEALANGNLQNLTALDLKRNEISDRGVVLLWNTRLPKLTLLSLEWNEISNSIIELLACFHYKKRRPLANIGHEYDGDKFGIYKFLMTLYPQCRFAKNFNPDSVKKAVFNATRWDSQGEVIKFVLDYFSVYPFLINSKDKQGHTLFHFYNHIPEVQRSLFEHGFIPEKERNQRRDSGRIAQDNQSVHDKLMVKRTNFFTKKLIESTKANEEQLKQAEASYVESIRLLEHYQNDPIKLRLLSLTDNEKRNVMEKTLSSGSSIPNDKEFIKTVVDQVNQALEKYLGKNPQGEYDEGYPANRIQYDYARDDAKITIPESIGYIKLLIDNFSVPLKEKKELLVTLMEQNPDLVKNKLSKVKEKLGNSVILDKEKFNKIELHGLLNCIDDSKKVDELFEEISCLDIEEVWREQKGFVLLKHIYIAATTYGKSSSACIQGTWTQIISSMEEISSEIVKQYGCYLEEEQKLEAQKNVITEENITSFVENLAKKLIQYVKGNPESKEVLRNHLLYLEHIDIDNPEKITFEQQKILAKINQEFTANITKFLVNYGRSIPKGDEYKIIIKELFKTEIMKDFALEKDDQPQILTQSNIKDLNQPAKHSQSVYSKIGTGCGVVIGIAGVALGVAIAVHLEMLAVGIAVGACCLIAAAIVYYCNQPSKSLENSNAERFNPEGLETSSLPLS